MRRATFETGLRYGNPPLFRIKVAQVDKPWLKLSCQMLFSNKIPTRPQFAPPPPRTHPPPFATPLYILCIYCININVPHQKIFQNRYISIYISIHVEGNLSDLLNMANSGQQTDNWQSLVFGDPYYTYSIYGL